MSEPAPSSTSPSRSPLPVAAALLLLAGCLAVLLPMLAWAAPAPDKPGVQVGDSCPVISPLTAADGSLRDFAAVPTYFLAVDGKEVPGEIYQSQHVTVLVISPALASPVLLRGGAVAAVALAKIEKRPDGTLAVRRDAVLTPQGTYQADNDELTWKVGGHTETLRARPRLDFLRDPAAARPGGRSLSPPPPRPDP
jgi:hypothetical protein